MRLSSSTPALLGGPPVRPQGPPPWPLLDEDVLHALQAAYHDGSWGKYHGGHVERLEQRLRDYHQIEHAAVCGSGTFAIELALRALRVGPGDEVILAAYDYPGNFLSVHAVGAVPVLVDLAPDRWTLDPGRLAAAVSPATRAVIVSHLHGSVAPLREFVAAAQGLAVIEDAAQAPGGLVQGQRAGTWGDAGVLSFGGSKLLTAGRGGVLLTRRADVAQRARVLLGRGNNLVCPLSELQAAVLLPQLDRLDARNAHRARSVALLTERLARVAGLRGFVNQEVDNQPGYYKLGFRLDAERLGLPREHFVAALRAEGIAFDEGFRALHRGRSPSRFRRAGDLAEADRAHDQTVVLHHPVLLGGLQEIEEVIRAVEKVVAHAEEIHRFALGASAKR
jgi:dTDP-4-amino-4,6-dideoxygalactose transaminase